MIIQMAGEPGHDGKEGAFALVVMRRFSNPAPMGLRGQCILLPWGWAKLGS